MHLQMSLNENDRTEFFNICEKEYAENEAELTIFRDLLTGLSSLLVLKSTTQISLKG